MFDTLSDRLSGILDKITGRGALSEGDVEDALREVRRALLEADVALEVVRTFTDKVREKAVGAEIVKNEPMTKLFFFAESTSRLNSVSPCGGRPSTGSSCVTVGFCVIVFTNCALTMNRRSIVPSL